MKLLEQLGLRKKKSLPNPLADGNLDIGDLKAQLDYDALKESIVVENHKADLKWKKRYYMLRTLWAFLTIVLLAAALWFTWWLVDSIGSGRLDFVGYETFLNIVAAEIVIYVLGLVAIVMKFLFPNGAETVGNTETKQ